MENFKLNINEANYTALTSNTLLLAAVTRAATRIKEIYGSAANTENFVIQPLWTNATNVRAGTDYNFVMFIGEITSNNHAAARGFTCNKFANNYLTTNSEVISVFYTQIFTEAIIRKNGVNVEALTLATQLACAGVLLKANLTVAVP